MCSQRAQRELVNTGTLKHGGDKQKYFGSKISLRNPEQKMHVTSSPLSPSNNLLLQILPVENNCHHI